MLFRFKFFKMQSAVGGVGIALLILNFSRLIRATPSSKPSKNCLISIWQSPNDPGSLIYLEDSQTWSLSGFCGLQMQSQ